MPKVWKVSRVCKLLNTRGMPFGCPGNTRQVRWRFAKMSQYFGVMQKAVLDGGAKAATAAPIQLVFFLKRRALIVIRSSPMPERIKVCFQRASNPAPRRMMARKIWIR
jgi:hypothetical protein